jgi:hypothetical protein
VRQRETLIDGHNVGDTIARVKHDTRSAARSVKRKHSLDGDIKSGGIECLEDDLRHLFSVRLGVDGRLGEEDRVLFGSHTELIVEGVVPNLLHVVPVGDHTMLNGVPKRQDATL